MIRFRVSDLFQNIRDQFFFQWMPDGPNKLLDASIHAQNIVNDPKQGYWPTANDKSYYPTFAGTKQSVHPGPPCSVQEQDLWKNKSIRIHLENRHWVPSLGLRPCTKHSWSIHKVPMKHPWSTHEASMKHPWSTHEASMKGHNVPSRYQLYIQISMNTIEYLWMSTHICKYPKISLRPCATACKYLRISMNIYKYL